MAMNNNGIDRDRKQIKRRSVLVKRDNQSVNVQSRPASQDIAIQDWHTDIVSGIGNGMRASSR